MTENSPPATTVETGIQSGAVLAKLFIFSLSLAVIPILSYFASEKYIWDGNSTFAALTAVVSANLVLASYIIVSVREEKKVASVQGNKLPPTESKKDK